MGFIYRALSSRYGWTPKEIAQMTFAQQNMYLNEDASGKGNVKTFGTMNEARAFINETNEG